MKKFNSQKFIQALANIGERQLLGEIKAAKLIQKTLQQADVKFVAEKYIAEIPKFIKSVLKVDGKNIPCMATCMVSGKLSGKHSLISSLITSQHNLFDANINFNPEAQVISRSNHYFAPAVAIRSQDMVKILKAQEVSGEVRVKKISQPEINFLVGNTHNPKTILFCHYDSLGPGAVDNASGTAMLLDLIINHPGILKDNLFAICANEELSYDQPIYWGHGYRVFERDYPKLLKHCRQILVVDGVGLGSVKIITDPQEVRLGFPIMQQAKYQTKIKALYGIDDSFWKVYHSAIDLPKLIKVKKFLATKKIILQLLNHV